MDGVFIMKRVAGNAPFTLVVLSSLLVLNYWYLNFLLRSLLWSLTYAFLLLQIVHIFAVLTLKYSNLCMELKRRNSTRKLANLRLFFPFPSPTLSPTPYISLLFPLLFICFIQFQFQIQIEIQMKCVLQMAAYHSALSSRVDCIEIDVSRSSDGVLFALHDRYIITNQSLSFFTLFCR